MTYLTAEQAQQIEEALQYSVPHPSSPPAIRWHEQAIATIRAARAQEDHIAEADKMVQEPVMDYERLTALRESEQNRAEDDYFNARPENDTPTLRKMFCNGFERGFHKGLKYAAPVRTKDLTNDEIYDVCNDIPFVVIGPDYDLAIARAVIAKFKEKNK